VGFMTIIYIKILIFWSTRIWFLGIVTIDRAYTGTFNHQRAQSTGCVSKKELLYYTQRY
jgi:hypothetical protein